MTFMNCKAPLNPAAQTYIHKMYVWEYTRPHIFINYRHADMDYVCCSEVPVPIYMLC